MYVVEEMGKVGPTRSLARSNPNIKAWIFTKAWLGPGFSKLFVGF